MRANTFGFYPLNGTSVVDFKENSTKESVCEFLEDIRRDNPEGSIVMVLDNFPSHWAKKTRAKAEELDIALVFLPPYSPDLNPIEYIWKSIKRALSPLLVESVEHLKELIQDFFKQLSQRLSFAHGWIRTFLCQL